jgi:Kef-type K+ transport system membrane component KefB
MNLLLTLGLLLVLAYFVGLAVESIGIPKLIGYVLVGIIFSPNSMEVLHPEIVAETHPLVEVCLAFIAFEVGGALKLSKIRKHEREILGITLLASFFPFVLIGTGILLFGLLFPYFLAFSLYNLILVGLLLGALASPTDPTATFAVMHQFKARGKVTDTIIGVAALDDAVGILLFSVTIGIISIFAHIPVQSGMNPFLFAFYQIIGSILLGLIGGGSIQLFSKVLKKAGEGQWIVVLISLVILCVGVAKWLKLDEVLAAMAMGVVVVNVNSMHRLIFRILERYTEEFIFLLCFLLSGLSFDIGTIPKASMLIVIFVLLRTLGKMSGAHIGARLANADKRVRRYTAGGLLPQGGIVIGLALRLNQMEAFAEISELLLTTIMGTAIIHELFGAMVAKRALFKAGELKGIPAKKS